MADLLQAVPPDDYFRHRDLSPVVSESVKKDARPFLALVGAPGTWEVTVHPRLPLFGFYKTNDRDNDDMPVSTHWNLVFTAPGREETVILPWVVVDKMPPEEEPAASPPPPGTTPKVTYSYSDSWRDVEFARLPVGPREWKVVLHAGDFLSNILPVRITGLKPEPTKPPAAATAPKPASSYPEADRKAYARHAGHPPAPDAGVAFARPVPSGSPDKPSLMLWGAFAFSEVPAPEAELLRLHLLFTAPDIPGGMSRTLAIPMAFVAADAKSAKGQFGVDLAHLFRGPSGKVQVPADLHVTAIRGGYIGQPRKLTGRDGSPQ